ncbi:hypothetical protein [uncultured Actinobacillus sp.]|uniref:hypothetical protein n=1 Tax=uncultured Actinobacillus sp. TaxID=417616 RepID=UPI0025FA58B5|nr:hypothetical protein [uncultured Actinobacillus sp.]
MLTIFQKRVLLILSVNIAAFAIPFFILNEEGTLIRIVAGIAGLIALLSFSIIAFMVWREQVDYKERMARYEHEMATRSLLVRILQAVSLMASPNKPVQPVNLLSSTTALTSYGIGTGTALSLSGPTIMSGLVKLPLATVLPKMVAGGSSAAHIAAGAKTIGGFLGGGMALGGAISAAAPIVIGAGITYGLYKTIKTIQS